MHSRTWGPALSFLPLSAQDLFSSHAPRHTNHQALGKGLSQSTRAGSSPPVYSPCPGAGSSPLVCSPGLCISLDLLVLLTLRWGRQHQHQQQRGQLEAEPPHDLAPHEPWVGMIRSASSQRSRQPLALRQRVINRAGAAPWAWGVISFRPPAVCLKKPRHP